MRRSTPKHFWSRCRRDSSGCWLWTGSTNNKGYGTVTYERRELRAHRLAYELAKGPIPTGLQIDHLCRTRDCINPAHLEAVKQRGITKNELKECCPRGHPYDTIHSDGRRRCRRCNAAAVQRSRARSGHVTVGIGKGGHERMKTHCPQGHEYTPDNIYRRGKWRHCKTCVKARVAARRKAAA